MLFSAESRSSLVMMSTISLAKALASSVRTVSVVCVSSAALSARATGAARQQLTRRRGRNFMVD